MSPGRPARTAAKILIVDDEPPWADLLASMLRSLGYPNTLARNDPGTVAQAVIDFDPDLILLDLEMPELDGIAVLQQLEAYTRRFFLPIVVTGTDISEERRAAALVAGARDFLRKPFDLSAVRTRVENLLETRFLHLELAERNAFFDRRVRERTREAEAARLEVLERLALVGEWRLDPSSEHPRAVGIMAAAIARSAGLDGGMAEMLRLAAPLHDIGMIAVPEAVLCKPGGLDAQEVRIMQAHTLIGGQLLQGEWGVLLMAARIAATHHEHWDGTGYPKGLAGEEIPVAARIAAIADVADALRQPRPHRPPWPEAEIHARIRELSGSRFDPRFVTAYFAVTRDTGATGE